MPTITELAQAIESGLFDSEFIQLYGRSRVHLEKQRYKLLLQRLGQNGPDSVETHLITAPGRTEIGGNHTDHNQGRIIAAAIDLDCAAAIIPTRTPKIILHCEQHSPDPLTVDLTELSPRSEEEGTPHALIRGVAAALFTGKQKPIGFIGHLNATCIPGIGISSSAAFSTLISQAFNILSFNNCLTPTELAIAAQKAENIHFGKPCGLMDQLASSMGMVILADFKNPASPLVETFTSGFEQSGYQLVLVDTGGSHTLLTPEYQAVKAEMQKAAVAAGGTVGRDISLNQAIARIHDIRKNAGDRALLRLLHFIEENERVLKMASCLRNSNFQGFLEQVKASGLSSCSMLQNCSSITSATHQGVLLAIGLSRTLFPNTFCRVHGGGFAGSIQSYVPKADMASYKQTMEAIFGHGTVHQLRIDRPGACCLGDKGLILPGDTYE